MKYILLIFITLNLFANNNEELLKEIQKIQNYQKSLIQNIQLPGMFDPFYQLPPKKEKPKPKPKPKPKIKKEKPKLKPKPKPLVIEAILNNEVKINGKWYKKGQYVRNLKIEKIFFDKILVIDKQKGWSYYLKMPKITPLGAFK